jgi:uncharacterized damage-inducible protein DinB
VGNVTQDFLIARWTEAGDKMVHLAEAFPEERFDFRPAEEVRTFADQLRHVAFWNIYVLKTVRGEEISGEPNELPREEYPTKAHVVDALRRSFDDVAAELGKRGASQDAQSVLPFVEHSAEHYGQLVVYCRLSGVVPPASRG